MSVRAYVKATTRAWMFLAMALCALGTVNAQVPYMHVPAFDAQATLADDIEREAAGELALYGRNLPVMAASDASGEWTEEQGQRVWRLGLSSPGALALEFLLDQVEVPQGASLRLLSTDGLPISEAVALGLAAGVAEASTPMALVDACIIEYREPLDALRQGRFRVSHLGHAYRDVQAFAEREGSCHVNVVCSPEGDDWEEAIRATVRISVVVPQGSGWCTGTLVNNVRQDCTPYILTAWHCGRTSTTAQFNQYKFYFNFQYASCTGGAYSTAQFITGAQLKAYSDDYDPQFGGVGGSDFMLLRTNVTVPEAYEPYWAGWNAENISTVTADGVCIHHPTGAPKRVSSFTQTVTTGHPMGSSGLMSHYRVKWAQTQNGFGVTEVGSSGSGLFIPHSSGPLLIGTLTGSSSGMSCVANTGTSYFGKTSYHWTNNPNSADIKLKPWLDPDNSGTLLLAGSANPCAAVGVEDAGAVDMPRPYPNPAQDQVTIHLGSSGKTQYRLRDAAGHIVLEGEWTEAIATLHVEALANGAYVLQLFAQGRAPRSTALIIVH